MTTEPEPRFVVTRKDGKDTMHRNPVARCDLRGKLDDQTVDEFTAEAMMLRGDATPCKWCIGDGWG